MLRLQRDWVTATGSRSGSGWRGQVQTVILCIFVLAKEIWRGFVTGEEVYW